MSAVRNSTECVWSISVQRPACRQQTVQANCQACQYVYGQLYMEYKSKGGSFHLKLPNFIQIRIGRGELFDAMRVNSPLYTAKEIKRELASVPQLKYDDSWLVPRPDPKPEEIQATSTSRTSSRTSLQYTPDVSHYKPYDPSELSAAPGFVMKDDDFPPL
ncbi:hypothetical protein GE061_007836 [Apolygus lucorum]|uniref:Uncharacterized protein n=1 Tax=Apolygus lucorum TaxID=248454 RepID=A0A6A4ITE0_APOLU|nr:hypothetical protein GE061_007836 [Apolygus lucorum]